MKSMFNLGFIVYLCKISFKRPMDGQGGVNLTMTKGKSHNGLL